MWCPRPGLRSGETDRGLVSGSDFFCFSTETEDSVTRSHTRTLPIRRDTAGMESSADYARQ